MPLAYRRSFFDRKKLILTVVFGVTVFLISLLCTFLLSPSRQIYGLNELKYTYSPRQSIHLLSPGSMTEIEEVEDVKRELNKQYLIIEAVLPSLSAGQLYINSFNGTARIAVDEAVIFDNLKDDRLASSSYIKIPLPENFAGKTIEIILYSPFSNEFSIGVIPSDCTLQTVTNLPYAAVIITAAVFVALLVSLVCTVAVRRESRWVSYIPLAVLALCLFVMLFEHCGLFAWPFNLKMCLMLAVPALYLLDAVVRCESWSPFAEAFLSLNVLYIICIAVFSGNIFFISLVKAGLILQIAGLVFVLHIFSSQNKSVSSLYAAATISFWAAAITFWYMLALGGQKLRMSLFAFIFAAVFYCLAVSLEALPGRRKEMVTETAPRFSGDVAGCTGKTDAQEAVMPVLGEASEWRDAGASDCFSVSKESLFSMICELVDKKLYGRDGHSLNVAKYTYILCTEMGMSAESAESISYAAALHDIGKVCIPEHILFKLEKLSENEFAEIRKHNVYGYQLLSLEDAPFFKMAALVAREHHEHIDGSGYLGLKGEEISLPARIVAVADVFDALVSPRSYKKSWSFEEAMVYIGKHRGDYFDTDAADAFMRAKDRIYDTYKLHLMRQISE